MYIHPMFLYSYPSCLYNTSQCVCRLHTPSCTIVKQCQGQNMPQGMMRASFDDWELFNMVHTASDNCNQFCRLSLLPMAQWCAMPTTKTPLLWQDKESSKTKTFSLQLIMARERVSQTKQVEVRDDVQECYTSLGALQLRTATTAPEAW